MKKLLIMMLALTFGATSCQKSAIELDPNGSDNEGEQVEVTLNLSTALTEDSETKGTSEVQTFTSDALDMTIGEADTKSTSELSSANDSKVNNLWILQFTKSTGAANGAPVYLSSTAFQQDGVEVRIPIELAQASVAQVFYVVANTGSSSLFSGSNAPATESALQAKTLSVGTELKPTAATGIPMLARIEVSKVDNMTVLTGTLERMFAKIKFTLTNSFSGFQVGYVQMKNVAANAYYRTAQTGNVNFPASATSSHTNYPSEAYKTTEYVWYVPENLRTLRSGQSVNNAGGRTLDKTDGKATYIEIGGYHMVGTTATPVTYRLPLGDVATNIGDFNVRRNHTYTLDVTLKGANTVDQRITVAESVTMATVSAVTAPSTATPANCFMVAPGGKVSFDARIRGNGGNVAGTGLSTAIAPASVALVWQDTPGLITNANSSTGVVPLSSGVATVTAKSGTNGNAVVAAYSGANGTGEILWSWHIWVTNYNLNYKLTGDLIPNWIYTDAAMNGQMHTYGTRYLAANPGKVIMDRNLGATQTSTYTGVPSAADAPKAFGMWYQWGRKDPLGQAASTSAFAPWYNAAGTAVTSANTAGPVTLTVAYQNPTTFYYSSSGDWLSAQNGNLWGNGGAKTIFDPCPAGWKVAKGGPNGTWNDFTSTGGDVASFQGSNEPYTGTTFPYFINGVQQTASGQYSTYVRNGRLYQQGAVKAWYPGEGYRIYSSGILNSVGNSGYSWGSGVSGNSSYHFSFSYDTIWPGYSGNRSSGLPVRCIQE